MSALSDAIIPESSPARQPSRRSGKHTVANSSSRSRRDSTKRNQPAPSKQHNPFAIGASPGLVKALSAFEKALRRFNQKKGTGTTRPTRPAYFDPADLGSSFLFAIAVLTTLLRISEASALSLLRSARRTFQGRALGRPKGRTTSEFQSLFIMVARECGLSRPQILTILDREDTAANIRWLERRIGVGRRLAQDHMGIDILEKIRSLPATDRSIYLIDVLRQYAKH